MEKAARDEIGERKRERGTERGREELRGTDRSRQGRQRGKDENAKNVPNRNSEYDEHLIFVRIVIPAGERLMLKRERNEKKNIEEKKMERNENDRLLLLLLFLSLQHVAHSHTPSS